MTTFITHRNSQSYTAGRFVREARAKMTPRAKAEKRAERLVFGMVLGLTAMACWTAADTIPSVMLAGDVAQSVTA
jgi:hypothetical protein